MLGEKPLVLSGRDQTFKAGKDTGRYWEAGASNVHWVVATTSQVDDGYRIAFDRVTAPGVLVEGTSFLAKHDVDYSIMVTTPEPPELKSSAVRMMPRMNAVYVNCARSETYCIARLRERLGTRSPVYSIDTLRELVGSIQRATRRRSSEDSQCPTG
jgi:hypothetical protein